MSVEIYGVDPETARFPTIAVAGEASFTALWQPAIDALGLKYIGNMRWLRRSDLPEILDELRRLSEAPHIPAALGNAAARVGQALAERWAAYPLAERLWMG